MGSWGRGNAVPQRGQCLDETCCPSSDLPSASVTFRYAKGYICLHADCCYQIHWHALDYAWMSNLQHAARVGKVVHVTQSVRSLPLAILNGSWEAYWYNTISTNYLHAWSWSCTFKVFKVNLSFAVCSASQRPALSCVKNTWGRRRHLKAQRTSEGADLHLPGNAWCAGMQRFSALRVVIPSWEYRADGALNRGADIALFEVLPAWKGLTHVLLMSAAMTATQKLISDFFVCCIVFVYCIQHIRLGSFCCRKLLWAL